MDLSLRMRSLSALYSYKQHQQCYSHVRATHYRIELVNRDFLSISFPLHFYEAHDLELGDNIIYKPRFNFFFFIVFVAFLHHHDGIHIPTDHSSIEIIQVSIVICKIGSPIQICDHVMRSVLKCIRMVSCFAEVG